MVKIEYKNPDKGYVGKGIGKVLRFPRVGIYEVPEKDAERLVNTFPDWFAYAYKTSQDPPDNPRERRTSGQPIESMSAHYGPFLEKPFEEFCHQSCIETMGVDHVYLSTPSEHIEDGGHK